MDEQEKELQRLSAVLLEHQVILQSWPERPHQEIPQAPPRKIDQLRHEAVDYLPCTVNVSKGAESRISHVPDLKGLPIIKREPSRISSQMWRFQSLPKHGLICHIATSTPIVLERPADYHMEQTPQIDASQVTNYEHDPLIHLEPQKEDCFRKALATSFRC